MGGYKFWILTLVIIGAVVWFFPAPDNVKQAPDKKVVDNQTGYGADEKHTEPKRSVFLFTVDKSGESLQKVEVGIDNSQPVENQIKETLVELFSGAALLAPLFPDDMTISEVFTYKGTATISLGSDFRKKIRLGVWTELLAVYSIVNTVTENFKGIDRVHILIDDSEADYFTSHVSITQPLTSDLTYVREEKLQSAG